MAAPMRLRSGCQRLSWAKINEKIHCFHAQRCQSSTAKESTATGNSLKHDQIGAPDPGSNIPPLRLVKHANESKMEAKFREQRQQTQEWNHLFWQKHNQNFAKLKEDFLKQKKQEKMVATGDESATLTPEEMTEFYKAFLDNNYKLHVQYNKAWYKKNFQLLWAALKVAGYRIIKKGLPRKPD